VQVKGGLRPGLSSAVETMKEAIPPRNYAPGMCSTKVANSLKGNLLATV